MIEPAPPVPLLVLDTNVVLDWIAFADPRVQPLVDAVERGAGNFDQWKHAAISSTSGAGNHPPSRRGPVPEQFSLEKFTRLRSRITFFRR